LTLAEFLRLPDIDEVPFWEYADGRVALKEVGGMRRSAVCGELTSLLDRLARQRGLGEAFVSLRCTYADRSVVPDVVFLCGEHIEVDERGVLVDETPWPPDIHVEVMPPNQPASWVRGKLEHSTAGGCALGLLIDLGPQTIEVFRPGEAPERLAPGGAVDLGPHLAEHRLPAAEVFGWLRLDD
jgi:Uma2 family endonuclease